MLQSLNIAFESQEARDLDIAVHKLVGENSIEASRRLAVMRGEPEGLRGYGMRNLTVDAIAPTTSSSIIIGGGVVPHGLPWATADQHRRPDG